MDLIQDLNQNNMGCCCDICQKIELLFINTTPIPQDVYISIFDENAGCSRTTLANLLGSALSATDDQDCTDKKLIGSVDIVGTITQFFESVTDLGMPVVDATDPNNVKVTLPYLNETCTITNREFIIPIPSPVSTFDSIDLKFDANGDLIVEAVYTDDDGNTSTITDTTPVTLPEDYVEYTGNNTIPAGAPPAGVDTKVLTNGDRYEWDGSAWILANPVDTFGTVLTSTGNLTTTNDVDIVSGDFYIEFPDGTTWADPKCPEEMTRAALIALRNAGGLDPQCHYIITDPSVDGNLDVEKILIHAIDANTLSGCYIKTSHDNTAWVGSYDIDTNDVERVFDHLNRNEVIGNGAILAFPFGNAAVTNNVVHHSTLTVTGGTVTGNTITGTSNVTVSAGTFANNTVKTDANVTSAGNTNRNTFSAQSNTTINSGDFLENNVEGDATVISSGVAVVRNHFHALSNTTINSGDFRNNVVANDATITSSTSGDVDSNTFGNLSNSVISGTSNIDNSIIETDANINVTAGTIVNCKFEQASNYIMSGGILRESTVGQDSDVTISSGDNYENVWGNSVIFRQVGTGYVRYSTFEGTTTWTNGDVNLSNVNSYVSTVNTTGSVGTISNSTFNRAYAINMQNVPSLTITDSTVSNYGQISINNAARLYLYRSTITDGSRILISTGSRIDASYLNVDSYGYVQSTGNGGYIRINYCSVSSLGYIRNLTVNNHLVERCNVSSNGNISFEGTSQNCRVYYSTATSNSRIYHAGTSNGCYIYNSNTSGNSVIYTQNSVNARIYYCTSSSRSYIRSLNAPATHYMYYCNAQASGYIQFNNSTGRIYACSASAQSILEKRGLGGNIYYSDFDSYFYAYITRTGGTSSGLFGKGRRTQTITTPVTLTPYAVGRAWLNF